MPRVNNVARLVHGRLVQQLESRIAGDGGIIAQLGDADIQGGTELSNDRLNGTVKGINGACDALLFRLESGG